MTRRKYIPLKVKLASALLQMRRPDESGRLVPIIAHEDAKLMSADQIISLFHFDHYPIFKAHGGPDLPWNLDPKPIAEHRTKTARVDIPQMAKTRSAREAELRHRAAMAEKAGDLGGAEKILAGVRPGRRRAKAKIANRPFAQGKRPLRSRNNLKRTGR